jgi:hypothetical protein
MQQEGINVRKHTHATARPKAAERSSIKTLIKPAEKRVETRLDVYTELTFMPATRQPFKNKIHTPICCCK